MSRRFFREVREPEERFVDAGKNSVSENLRVGAEILKRSGTFTPNPETSEIVRNCNSFLELGEAVKRILDEKKAERDARLAETKVDAVTATDEFLRGMGYERLENPEKKSNLEAEREREVETFEHSFVPKQSSPQCQSQDLEKLEKLENFGKKLKEGSAWIPEPTLKTRDSHECELTDEEKFARLQTFMDELWGEHSEEK